MKKSLPIRAAVMSLFLLFTSATISFAQDSHVAILLNVVNSRLHYGDMNSALREYKKDVRGLQAGLSWQAGITEHFSIVTEAYFMKKGGTLKTGNPLDGIRSTLKLYTFELPVLARLHTGRFYFNAGPYTNYILSGKTSSETEASHAIVFGREPGKFRKWEGGMQAGAGYQFRLKNTKMALDLRYIHGLTSLSPTDDLYNRTMNISVLVFKTWKHQPEQPAQ